MSGWTNITIEPNDGNPSKNTDELIDQAKQQLDDGDYSDAIETIENLSTDVSAADKVLDCVEDKLNTHRVRQESSGDVVASLNGRRGLADDETGSRELARDILSECPFAERVLIVSANDTTDAGNARLFKRGPSEGSDVVHVDFKEGYESAEGYDATGYMRDKHGIHGTPSRRV